MKPFVSIYMDRVYRLRLTYSVIFEYEQLTEKMICALSILDPEDMISLLWIMMRQDRPELTFEAVYKTLSDLDNKTEIFASISEAIRNSINTKATDAPGEPEFFDIEGQIKTAADIGISIKEFYDMTPAEFDIVVGAYIKKRRINHNELYTLAWYSAFFPHLEGSKKLADHLIEVEKPTPDREMTEDEMLKVLKVFCVANGGKVVEEDG
jgi:hypothetical protein